MANVYMGEITFHVEGIHSKVKCQRQLLRKDPQDTEE
jgi:hypothetical protein